MSQYVGAACLTMWTPRVIARCAEFRFRRRDQSIESMREPHSQRSHRIGGTPAMANNFCCSDHPRRMLRVCRSRHRQQRLQDKSRCARESARIRSTTCASSLDSSVTQTGHKRFSSCEATEDPLSMFERAGVRSRAKGEFGLTGLDRKSEATHGAVSTHSSC